MRKQTQSEPLNRGSSVGSVVNAVTRHSVLKSAVRSLRVRSARSSGLTLLDMVITLLLLGIVAALITPRFFGLLCNYRADAAAARITADLRSARSEARTSGTTVQVSFDTAADRYTIAPASPLPSGPSARTILLNEYPWVTDISKADFGGASTVTFDAWGQSDVSGVVSVTSGEVTRSVVLDSETGRVSTP